ncbi:tyrosine-type recombinase/integrase [Variovorax paradoxus]|uniref:site-specific integrase n=1 Tax=Variovorax paradoxus TaxID=34073 RepID=UPI00215E1659|nr:site-specific integrase [Variovorax paradoxus]UVH55172.1 tyrosine-type recombinase/integrase [Variovorax paradoxus]
MPADAGVVHSQEPISVNSTASKTMKKFRIDSSTGASIASSAAKARKTTARHTRLAKPIKPLPQFKHYLVSSVADSTRRAYAGDLRHFRDWGGRIPATPAMVARYLAAYAGKVKASTLNRRLAAIASAHTVLGKPSPTRSELVRTTMRGIRRVHGSAQRQAKPLSVEMLRVLAKPQRHLDPLRDLRDRALLVVGFAGGFRRSELARLKLEDLAFDAQGVTVTLVRSKTDQQGKGRVVALPHGPGRMCPVKLLKAWIQQLRKQSQEEAMGALPLFRRVDRYGRPGGGLSGAAVGGVMRRRMRDCGLDPSGFSAHSLRSGLVTAAARAGVPTWAIQRQTGHRSESTVHRYIRGLSPFERNAFGSISN